MRRFLILSVSLLFTLQVAAAPAAAGVVQKNIHDMIVKQGLSKGQKSFADFLRGIKNDISAEDYQVLQSISNEAPDLIIPKVDMRTIQKNGQEIVQLNLTSPGQSALVEVSDVKEGDVQIKVISSIQGKPQKVVMNASQSASEFKSQFMKILAQFQGETALENKVQFLSFEDVMTMTQKEKNEYFREIQRLYVTMAEFYELKNKKSTAFTNPIWDLMLEKAEAKAGDTCVLQGFIDKVGQDGICGSEGSNNKGGNVQCNPAIFGKNAGKVSITAPADACLKRYSNADVIVDSSSKASYEASIKKAKKALTEIEISCRSITDTKQKRVCGEYHKRAAALNLLECPKGGNGNDGSNGDRNGGNGNTPPKPLQPKKTSANDQPAGSRMPASITPPAKTPGQGEGPGLGDELGAADGNGGNGAKRYASAKCGNDKGGKPQRSDDGLAPLPKDPSTDTEPPRMPIEKSPTSPQPITEGYEKVLPSETKTSGFGGFSCGTTCGLCFLGGLLVGGGLGYLLKKKKVVTKTVTVEKPVYIDRPYTPTLHDIPTSK